MKYDRDNIINAADFLLFYGHKASADGSISESCLSQWWPSSFVVEGITFNTAEHWMMAQKALLFQDHVIYEKVLRSSTPGEAKKLGRLVKNYHEETWIHHRFQVVKTGNLYKFRQNIEIADFLKNTTPKILVEASPTDSIWGIGLSKNHKNALNPELWPGLNLLGFALMEVRDEL